MGRIAVGQAGPGRWVPRCTGLSHTVSFSTRLSVLLASAHLHSAEFLSPSNKKHSHQLPLFLLSQFCYSRKGNFFLLLFEYQLGGCPQQGSWAQGRNGSAAPWLRAPRAPFGEGEFPKGGKWKACLTDKQTNCDPSQLCVALFPPKTLNPLCTSPFPCLA